MPLSLAGFKTSHDPDAPIAVFVNPKTVTRLTKTAADKHGNEGTYIRQIDNIWCWVAHDIVYVANQLVSTSNIN